MNTEEQTKVIPDVTGAGTVAAAAKTNANSAMQTAAVKPAAGGEAQDASTSKQTHENHNYRRHRSIHENGSGTGSEQELESLRIEYQNLFDRSNKLDNKVYITVTFLGFMFVFITSLFGTIPKLSMTGVLVHDILLVLYVIVDVAVAITYVWNLVYFMELLAPEQIVRLDPDKIAAAQLDKLTIRAAERRLIKLYRKIINEDLEKLHIRCDRFVDGLRFVIITLVLSFVSYGIQILLGVL